MMTQNKNRLNLENRFWRLFRGTDQTSLWTSALSFALAVLREATQITCANCLDTMYTLLPGSFYSTKLPLRVVVPYHIDFDGELSPPPLFALHSRDKQKLGKILFLNMVPSPYYSFTDFVYQLTTTFGHVCLTAQLFSLSSVRKDDYFRLSHCKTDLILCFDHFASTIGVLYKHSFRPLSSLLLRFKDTFYY